MPWREFDESSSPNLDPFAGLKAVEPTDMIFVEATRRHVLLDLCVVA